MRINRPRFSGVVVSPRQLQKLFSREGDIAIENQHLQQLKFPRRQIEFHAAFRHPAAG